MKNHRLFSAFMIVVLFSLAAAMPAYAGNTRAAALAPASAAAASSSSAKTTADIAKSYYETGRDFFYKEDYESALSYLEAAVKGGCTEAKHYLGMMYVDGYGVDADWKYAYDLFSSIIEEDCDPLGCAGLGYLYLRNGDYENAIEFYKLGKKYGDADSINGLGLMYSNGFGVSKDHKQAWKLLIQADRRGSLVAKKNLGWAYENALGVKKDVNKAASYYKKAAGAGLYKAYLDLARLYTEVNKDNETALSYYELAADSGYIPAMTALGSMYYSGVELADMDVDTAKYYYGLAAEKGSVDAAAALGIIYYNEESYKEALGWYLEAAKKDNVLALLYVGIIYDKGQGVAEDNTKALYYYNKAADLGSAAAMNNIGTLYEFGEGVKKDTDIARSWYKKAADAGSEMAAANLAAMEKRAAASNTTSTKSSITKKDMEKVSDELKSASEVADTLTDLFDVLGKDDLKEDSEKAGKWLKGISSVTKFASMLLGD